MAKFYPDMSTIRKNTMEKATDGELRLLDLLAGLNDTYNIYFQPHINIAHPDVIIERENSGLLVIEVKDWVLRNYQRHEDSDCLTTPDIAYKDGSPVPLESPFRQVERYKAELFKVMPTLATARLNSVSYDATGKHVPFFSRVQTAVYFYKGTTNDVERLWGSPSLEYGRRSYGKRTICWTRGAETQIVGQISGLFTAMSSVWKSKDYTDKEHKSVTEFLKPSDAWLEQAITPTLSKQQETLAQPTSTHRKIKGVAGSGKTLILAKKAVNCYKATKKPVLILTFNITLRNYIRDKIALFSRDMSRSEREAAFEIIHFHALVPQMPSLLELQGYKDSEEKTAEQRRASLVEGMKFLRSYAKKAGKIQRYGTVLIDEGQDWEPDWFKFVGDTFIGDNTYRLVMADAKQNVYNRPLDSEKMPSVLGLNLTGNWYTLKTSYRLASNVMELAATFQKEFLRRYDADEVEQGQLFNGKLAYEDLGRYDRTAIYHLVQGFMHECEVSPNDVCVLSETVEKIRELAVLFGEPDKDVETMCETQEEFEHWSNKFGPNTNALKDELDDLRRVKKFCFNMNPGVSKLCTIKSFKGWEISTVVLLLEDTPALSDEGVYTAITRAKHNLLVINCGNKRYAEFFETQLNGGNGENH